MIKKLIFMAALLAPCLAYGQNPSANLSVQVVSSGNGIPCVYGPNFTGAIPAPAQRAGYTTCYANYDFSTPFMGTLSNWLDCAGASRPLFYNTGYLNGATPCSRYAIVSDTVNGNTQNILDMVYTLADAQAKHSGTWMNTVCGQGITCNTGAGSGIWPVFGWFDMTMKVTPANLNVFAPWFSSNPSAYIEDMDYFGVVVNNSRFIEWDALEVTAFNGNPYSATSNVSYGPNNGVNNFAGVPTFAYNNYGILVTSDGSSTYSCAYLNQGTPDGCNSATTPDAGLQFTQWGTGPISGNTATQCSAANCPTPSQDLHLRIARMVVFTCSTWASAPCHETPITTP